MSLNRKDFEILSLLSSKEIDERNLKNLSKIFKTTERGMRYSIENINYYLKGISSSKINIANGHIDLSFSPEDLRKFCSNIYREEYIFSKDEREEYILISTFFKKSSSLIEFQNYFQISNITLKKDLKNINESLKRFQLSLEVTDKKVFILGNEKKLRHLKMVYALKYMYLNKGTVHFLENFYFFKIDILNILKTYIEDQDTSKCIKIVKDIEIGIGTTFEKEFINIITIYLIVTFERVSNGNIICKKNNADFLKKTKSFEVIKEIIFPEYDLNYQYEALHLAEYFLSGYNSEDFYENRFSIDIFVYKVLEKLQDSLGVDLLNDKELIECLIEYLITAVYRIKNNFVLNTNLDLTLDELKIKIHVEESINDFMFYLKEPLRDEEIIWVTRAIIKKISNIGLSKLSLATLLNIIKSNSFSSDIDKIASEVHSLYPDLVKDDRDIYKTPYLLDIISEEVILFSENIPVSKAIKKMADILIAQKLITREYSHGVIEMIESSNYNYFIDEKVVLCYGKEYSHSLKTGASIIFFKDEMLIDNEKTMKTLILVSNKNRDKHLKIVSDLEKLISIKNFFLNASSLEKGRDVIDHMESILKYRGI